jgi:hypothetical protein
VTVSRLNQLPDVVIAHLIRGDNDRTTYPLISKRFYRLWLQAGLDAVSDKKNPFMRELTARWERDPRGVDRLLHNVVMNWFFPKIAILPIVEFGDVSLPNLLKYRAVEQLNQLHSCILQAEDEQLVAVARKFMEHSESVEFALRQLDGTWPIAQQAEFVRDKFKNDRTISVRIENQNHPQLHSELMELFSTENQAGIPEEILGLDVNPEIVAAALDMSVGLNDQMPFAAAVLRSSKRNEPRVQWFINHRFQSCMFKEGTEFVKLFLESPGLSLQNLEAGLLNSTHFVDAVTHETRLEICRLLLADRRISPESQAVNVATLRAIVHTNPNQAELLELIRLFIEYRRAANLFSILPGESLRMAVSVEGRSLANRLAVIDLLINDPAMSNTEFPRGLNDATYCNGLSQHDRLEVIRLLLTCRCASSSRLGEALDFAVQFGQHSIEDRLAVVRLLLAEERPHVRISNKDVGEVFRSTACSPRILEHLPVMDLFLADARVSDEHCIDMIIKGHWYASDVSPFFIAVFQHMLDHPSMTTSRLWKCAVALRQSRTSQAQYRQALGLVAEHRLVGQMPIALRVWLAFERAWGWLSSPVYAVINALSNEEYIMGTYKQEAVTMVAGGLLLPVTLFRAAISNFLDFDRTTRLTQPLHLTRTQAIVPAQHIDLFLFHQLFENRVLPQLLHHQLHIRLDRLLEPILFYIFCLLDSRFDLFFQRFDVFRVSFEHSFHGPALLVAEHDEQRRIQHTGSVFNAVNLEGADHVASNSYNEQVSETLVEDELRCNPGV